jgi:hypothetical protein
VRHKEQGPGTSDEQERLTTKKRTPIITAPTPGPHCAWIVLRTLFAMVKRLDVASSGTRPLGLKTNSKNQHLLAL